MVVAIGILTSGVVSVVSLVTASLSATTEGTTRLVASNLAREGVEIARNMRDSNWIGGQPYLTGMVQAGTNNHQGMPVLTVGGGNATWAFTFTGASLANAATAVYQYTSSPTIPGAYTNSAGGVPAGTAATIYNRIVFMYPICRNDTTGVETVAAGPTTICAAGTTQIGLDVRSSVRWTLRKNAYVMTAEEKLYDWR